MPQAVSWSSIGKLGFKGSRDCGACCVPPLSAERSEPVIADSAVSAQLRGQSPNPALDNSLYATTAMLQEIGSDSDSVADSVVNEGQDNLANSGISVQEDARSRHGRERRKPQRYGEWA